MTQEDRELLLKDLCARLPYKVKVHVMGTTRIFDICILLDTMSNKVEVKPYLRPIPSMTEEETEEYFNTMILSQDIKGLAPNVRIPTVNSVDWLLKNHFDYRWLIEKGLAIAVTEENNPYKE